MKNIWKLLLLVSIMNLIALSGQSQTNTVQSKQEQKQTISNPTPGTFVDKDNNGVCDNLGTRSGNGRGANFVDKNGDGICDNRANAGNKCRNGQGNKNGNGQCRGPRNCGRR